MTFGKVLKIRKVCNGYLLDKLDRGPQKGPGGDRGRSPCWGELWGGPTLSDSPPRFPGNILARMAPAPAEPASGSIAAMFYRHFSELRAAFSVSAFLTFEFAPITVRWRRAERRHQGGEAARLEDG